MTATITIEALAIPDTLDRAEGGDEFRRAVEIRNTIVEHSIGLPVMAVDAHEMLVGMQDQAWFHKHRYVARRNGEIVGQATMEWDATVPTNVTWLGGGVLPDHRNRGVGTALFDHMEALAHTSGRSVIQRGAIHANLLGGERLGSPTGFGSVPTDDPGVRFLRKHGYTLEQVYRISVLDLPVGPEILAAHRDAAEVKAGSVYRVHTWTGPAPEQWLDDIALLSMRMATDAPSAGMEIDEEVWDAVRIRAQEARAAKAGRTHFMAVVEHLPTGQLVALNGVLVPDNHQRPVQQGPTLVLKEHRGHRLGMLVKVANIQQLAEHNPESSLIITDNAEENRPMLDVNEAVGFRAIGYEGAWKKTI